jgi:hypothetical protein
VRLVVIVLPSVLNFVAYFGGSIASDAGRRNRSHKIQVQAVSTDNAAMMSSA